MISRIAEGNRKEAADSLYDDSDYHLFHKVVHQLNSESPLQKQSNMLQSIFKPKSLKNEVFSEYNYKQDKFLLTRKQTILKPKTEFARTDSSNKNKNLIDVNRFKEKKISFIKKKLNPKRDDLLQRKKDPQLNFPKKLTLNYEFLKDLQSLDEHSLSLFIRELQRLFDSKFKSLAHHKKSLTNLRNPSLKIFTSKKRQLSNR